MIPALLLFLAAGPDGLALPSLTGGLVRPFAAEARAQAFVFIHPDCPVSNRYVPEINRLQAEYAGRGIRLWVVYPGRQDKQAAIAAHYAEFGLRAPALRDPDFALADLAGATMTPEAAVFIPVSTSLGPRPPTALGPSWRVVYRGRIDDRAVRLGVFRAEPRTRDLAGVLDRLARGDRVEPSTTQPVGCYIRPLS